MQSARYLTAAVAMAVLVTMVACQPQRKASQPVPPIVKKHAHADIYALDSAQSWIKLKVYRAGPLARFGHNHAITIEQISGLLYREKSLPQSEIEFSFPVTAMVVDRAADRAEAGVDFTAAIAPEAVAGTRENMLGPKLLAAQQYPIIKVRSVSISDTWPDLQMVVAIKLREVESQLTMPVHITEQDGVLSADGETGLSQVQLGLTPYSVLGGGLRVGDAISARFHLVAVKTSQK